MKQDRSTVSRSAPFRSTVTRSTVTRSTTTHSTATRSTVTRAREMAERLLGKFRHRGERVSVQDRTGHVFQPGDVLAKRYRVVRFLGRGGAGQVYQVEDLELGEQVALKTLHPRLAASPEALEQFKREVLLARGVTHENVCRLLEFGRDAGRFFVTMELLLGETLAERMRRVGRLEGTEALDLVSQVALALRAAHRRGVIHRDIKGSNVILVESSGGSTRAVVTDFGIALDTPGGDPEIALPSPARLEGTPLFMAPEQVCGEPVSAATDIYALGVLLYHMVTADWPFIGSTAVSTALLRIEQDPRPPSKLVAGLDHRLEALILRCLERDPADRPASADAFLDQIRAITDAGRRARARRPAKRLVGLAAALLLGLGVGGPMAGRKMSTPSFPESKNVVSARRPAVLVLPFENLTGRADLAWLTTAMRQGFSSALAAGEHFLLLGGEEAERIRADLDLGPGGGLEAHDLERLARRSGAEWVLSGSYRLTEEGEEGEDSEEGEDGEDGLAIEVRLIGLGRGSPGGRRQAAGDRPVYSSSLRGTPERLGDLISRAASNLRHQLHVEEPSALQVRSAAAALPAHPVAARLYAEGVDALRAHNARRAREKLERSLAHEGEHALVSAALAEAWALLGYSERSREAAERALESSDRLLREAQLAVEARYRLAVSDWKRAEEIYRALREFFPDNLEYGLLLAEAQQRGARYEAAYETLAALRDLPAPFSEDPRIDLTEAMTAQQQGDSPRGRKLAASAGQKARRIGARSLLAKALDAEALTMIYSDTAPEVVIELLEEARRLYDEVGHRSGSASVLLSLGGHARRLGELDRAERYLRRALEIAEEIGQSSGLARGQTLLAIVLDQRGRLSEGLEMKEKVLDNYRRRDVRQGIAVTLENLGISLLKMGRPLAALERFEESAARFEAIGDQVGLAWTPYYRGRAWLDLGELELARSSFEAARENAAERPEGGLLPDSEFELARIELARGQLQAARARVAAVIESYDRLRQSLHVAEAHLLLGRIQAAQGERRDAARRIRGALAVFAEQGAEHLALAARSELTRILLAENGAEAWTSCDALGPAATLEHRRIALRARVVLVRCDLARGGKEGLLRSELRAVIAEATALGLYQPRLEAESLLAQELRSPGDREGGR